MSKTYKFWFNKLVRDKAIEIMSNEGIVSNAIVLEHQEYVAALKNKLLEEAKEVAESCEEELLDELADVMEVMHCIANVYGFSMDEIENARLKKSEKRGSFKFKIFIFSVTTRLESGRLIDYMKSKPREYIMEEVE